jgi:hypothetical protein
MAKYDLYVAGDCISEHDNYEEVRKAFYEEVKNHPDCPIDILAEDGETSLLSYDEQTEQVYNYK